MAKPKLRTLVIKEDVNEASELIISKLAKRLLEKGSFGYISNHETLGIVAEEYHELVDAVRSNKDDEVKAELTDIAVGCLFGVASMIAREDMER